VSGYHERVKRLKTDDDDVVVDDNDDDDNVLTWQ